MSTQRAQGVLLFLVLAVNSTRVQKLHALTLATRSYAFLVAVIVSVRLTSLVKYRYIDN